MWFFSKSCVKKRDFLLEVIWKHFYIDFLDNILIVLYTKNQTTKYMENSIKKTQDKVDWTDYPKEVIIQFRTASWVAERSGIKLTLKVQFAEGYGGAPEILPVQSNIIAISKVVDYAVIEETDANFIDVFDINDVEVRNNKFGRISISLKSLKDCILMSIPKPV